MNPVVTIDCHYVLPRVAASYLLTGNDEAVFIENNTSHAVPYLLAALKEAGFSPEQVKYAVITHVHLDHAGGSSALLRACPNAVLLAHPKAAKHIIDPSRLVASAKQVYGEEQFERLYGTIDPVSPDRVRVVQDGEVIEMAGRKFLFFYTAGHATHHFCVYDEQERSVFTGDTFGIAYPDLSEKELFLYPSSTPTDFDPVEAKKSVRRILDLKPEVLYPTHFGPVRDIQKAGELMNRGLDFLAGVLQDCRERVRSGNLDRASLEDYASARILEEFYALASDTGLPLGEKEKMFLNLDSHINAQGVAHAALRRS